MVTVRTGGDRSGDRVVGPLVGVRLGLYADDSAPDPVNAIWARCTSDADGDCSFTVPDTATGAANHGAQLTVRQLPDGVPAGWYTDPSLRVGPGSGSGSIAQPYLFRTPALEADRTYRSSGDFMFSDTYKTNYTASGGVWQQSRENPPLPPSCGLDVAVVLDLSASVGSSLPALKKAADTFTDALTGTPSRMALFSFDQASPSTSVAQNHPALMPVSTQSGGAAFKKLYAGWTLGKGTNWDQGLWAVAKAAPHYQATVVITDGNPTRFADNAQGDGSNTHFADVENGVFSANALKAEGTRVVALGVGSGVTGVSALNLRAISGPTAFTGANVATADYSQAADFATAGQQLRNLALAHCEGSLTVVKQIAPAATTGEDTTGSANAPAGWHFHASTTTSGVTGLPDDQTTTDDGTGTVNFTPNYSSGATSAAVTVTETQHNGHTLVTQGGRHAVCTDLDTGATVPVTDTATTTAPTPGFTVHVPSTTAVSCLLYNRPLETTDLTVDKVWMVDGVRYPQGRQPHRLNAALTLTGPDPAPASAQPWGVPRTGYHPGQHATLTERTTLDAPGCTLTGTEITAVNAIPASLALPHTLTLTRAHEHAEVTNTVTCTTPSSTVPPGTGEELAATGADLLPAAGAALALCLTGATVTRLRRRSHRY